MKEDIKKVGVGVVTLAIFGFVGLLGFSFFKEIFAAIIKIGIETVLENTLFVLLGIIGAIIAVTTCWIVGHYVDKNVIEQ